MDVVRMVSRRDVQVVVENVKPFLFRTGPDSLKRMSLYLTSGRQGIGKVKKKRLILLELVAYRQSRFSVEIVS